MKNCNEKCTKKCTVSLLAGLTVAAVIGIFFATCKKCKNGKGKKYKTKNSGKKSKNSDLAATL